ncbi:MAG: peptidylprolyl isomerase, partial [Chloroflexota bacterium]|nr:peptidylprolyl isomerase [Chloroflexota bacterium]
NTVYDYETTAETDQYQSVVDQQPPVTDEDWIYGNPNAPITVVEYEDFQCPACPGFSLGIKQLIAEFPSSIRVVFRHLPLPSIHDKAYISSMAAEAAGAQGKFWEMHDVLYMNQQAWTNLSEDDFVDWVIGQAEALDLDAAKFEEDLYDKDARAALEETTKARLNMGMHYTPFVVVNDRIWRNNNPDLYALIGIYEFGGYEECPPWVIDPEKSYTAVLDTSAGEIQMDLFADVAPLAVNSFVFLSQEGWYDGVYFHRVVEDFVAQAGDPSGLGAVGPGYTFDNETDNGLSFDSAGVLGMANVVANTNGSQFFITFGPATDLDGGYTIFGQVVEGSLDLLNEISLRNPASEEEFNNFDNATIINGIEIIEN